MEEGGAMFSDNALFEMFAQRSLIRQRGGGVEIGEINQALATIGAGGIDEWVSTFDAFATRLNDSADRNASPLTV